MHSRYEIMEAHMKGTVEYEKKGTIAYITIDRPEKRNALDESMISDLRRIWDDFADDTDTRVAILSGAGSSFCAGIDMGLFLEGKHPDPEELLPGMEISKPIIAAVNGYALGSGFKLALSCDLRVAAETAFFGVPEAKRGHIGDLPRDLLQYMPMGIAMELLVLGEPISAQRAYDIGLVNRITTEEKIVDEANNLAQIISDNAPLCVKVCKVGLYWDAHLKRREESFLRRTLLRPQMESKDLKEGINAFKKKRRPDFKRS
jgi:enoyl-CoA hydratase/carnithine racemase